MLVTKTAAPRSARDRLVDMTEPPLGTSEDGTDQSLLHGGAAGRVVTTSGPKKVTRVRHSIRRRLFHTLFGKKFSVRFQQGHTKVTISKAHKSIQNKYNC